jgi:hypothetical protein
MRDIDILANHFEYKLRKEAQAAKEIDSTSVTMIVRPTVNTIISQNPTLANIVQGIANKLVTTNPAIRGNLAINSFIVNASLVGGKWKINPATSGFKATGSLMADKSVPTLVKNALSSLNSKIFATLEKEFNRISQMDKEGWSGTTITNHETDISGSDFDLTN